MNKLVEDNGYLSVKEQLPSTSYSMQSNLFPEDSLFGYWNELDGGPPPIPPGFVGLPSMPPHPHPMLGGPPPPPPPFDNGPFGFIPPPIALPCPVEPPPMCPPPPMGPVVHRNFPRYPPATLAPLQAMIPGPGPQPPPPLMGQVTQHFGSFQRESPHLPPPIPLDPVGLERTQLNDIGQMEQVVVKNGQVFHISFLDEPSESLTPGLPTPISENGEGEAGESRDWINYDELPLLKEMASKKASSQQKNGYEDSLRNERFDCKLCGTRFNRSSKLEHHVQQHHPEALAADEAGTPLSPSPSGGTPALCDFSNYCVECEEFFRSAEDLQNHMEQNHRLIDEAKSPKEAKKNIGCPFCLETFEWPCMLKTHMTKHTGEKPFICERCNVSFRFVQSFYRHNRRVHGREK